MVWSVKNSSESRKLDTSLMVFGMLFAIMLLSGAILSSSISSADTEKQSDATVTVGSACTMFRESTVPHVVSVGPSSYREDVGTTRLKTVCNDTNGYAIYAIGYSNDIDGDTNMYGEEHGLTIPTGTETGDISNWSMKLSKDLNSYNPENLTITPAFTNYTPIPSTQTKVASFEGATDTTDGSIVETTYAIRVSSDQLADTYTGQVKYTMVHPADGTAPEGPEPVITYIQDINKDTCPTTPTTVVDSRDGNEYTIQKLADGNCWLLDNLRLDLTDSTVQSKLSSSTTNASDATLNYLKNGGGTASDQYAIAGVANWTNGYSYSVPLINTASIDTTGAGGYEAGKYGIYYNFCAASAGSYCYGNGSSEGTSIGDSVEDICPKGWRMPTGGDSGEYNILYSAYSSDYASFVNALRTPLSGFFVAGSFLSMGSEGLFRSSARSDNTFTYSLYVDKSSHVDPRNNDNRLIGDSVRCIAKEPEPQKPYMQDIDDWRDTFGVNQSVVAVDKRDGKEYWVTKLETDPAIPDERADCVGTGSERICTQIWMTQNLDFDLTAGTKTYTHADTDLGWNNNDTDVIWTPQVATTTNNNEFVDIDAERSFDYGDVYLYTSGTTDRDLPFLSLSQCVQQGYTEDDCIHYHVGNVYNYYAAFAIDAISNGGPVAVSDSQYSTMPNSVCPAGWRMPAGRTAADDYSDFDFLLYRNSVAGVHTAIDLDPVSYATHVYGDENTSTNGFNNLRTQPLWFTRTGYIGSGVFYGAGTSAHYWSGTVFDDLALYGLSINFNRLGLVDELFHNGGFSVRCVARTGGEPEPDKLYIQDVTAETCPTTPTTVYDRRDQNTYTIRKLEDGNCWMLDNLRLIDRTISSADSNLPAGESFTIPASSDSNFAYYDNNAAYIDDTYGGYYSLYTATVGYATGDSSTGDSPKDICPKGWHMPSNEYELLYRDHYKTFDSLKENLNLPLSGYIADGSFTAQNGAGFYWYAKVANPGSGMTMVLNGGSSPSINITNPMTKYIGLPVRCLASVTTIPESDYYMQDVAEWKDSLSIGQSVKAIDRRDGKEYWVTKLKTDSSIPDDRADCTHEENNRVCTQLWMTQNLDLDLKSTKTYTHDDTDLGWTTGESDTVFNVKSSTVSSTNWDPTISGYDPGGIYVYTSGTTDSDIKYDSLGECVSAGHSEDDCWHYHAGNIYWLDTAIASNATINGQTVVVDNSQYKNAPNSICPAGWKLPDGPSSENGYSDFAYLMYANGITLSLGDLSTSGLAFYAGDGFNKAKSAPFWFTRVGYNSYSDSSGSYWTNTFNRYMPGAQYAFAFQVYTGFILNQYNNSNPTPIRCVARESSYFGSMSNSGGSEVTPEPVLEIQDITPASCPTEPTIVRDSRDGEKYTIQKLADGKCWMLDNLRLGKSLAKVLTPDDTNIRSNFTLPGSVSLGFDEYELPQINIDSRSDTASYGGGENKIGVYYNYCAATAGTFCQPEGESSGTPAEDICPKGWRLPTGGENGEYQQLYNQYSSYAGFKNALRASLSGYFKYSQTNHQGSYGSFWSSTPVGNDKIYSLDVRVSSVPNDFTSYRTAGISIRCVAYDAPAIYIQDITPDSCPTTPTVVYDTRDNSAYTIQKLADDKCWMLDNLRLGRSTVKVLTPSDTNIVKDYTLPGSISTDFNSYVYPQINIDSKNKVTSYGDGDNKIGVYYNYCAATAGTYCMPRYEASSSPKYDICPKGWRLATGGEEGEFQNLYNSYSTYSDFKNALHASLSGYYKYNNDNHQGSYGSFWSSTPVGNDKMYSLDVRINSVPEDFTSYRTAGLSIRCVAKKTYIQDVTAETCPAERTLVYDRRDEKPYYIQQITANGETLCWMTTNLDLDGGTTLTADTSNVGIGFTYKLPVSSSGSNDFTDPNTSYVYNSHNTECDGDNPCYSYYSWKAAVAGTSPAATSEALYDICPKGWRLPAHSEYLNLETLSRSVSITGAPWFGVYSGRFYNGEYYSHNSASFYNPYWSAQSSNAEYATDFYIYHTGTTEAISKKMGAAVRCVAKEPALQDITHKTCPKNPTKVYDKRDGEKYTIQQLADGRCWMLDNLRLDLADLSIYNLRGETNASTNTLKYLFNGGGTTSDKYATGGVIDWPSGNSYSVPHVYSASKDDLYSYGDGSNKIGVYYNYCAASAGSYCYGNGSSSYGTPSGDATEDICPRGWRMPTANGSGGEYRNLYNAYYQDKTAFNNALHFSLYGQAYNNQTYYRGSYGFAWASGYATENQMHFLREDEAGVYPYNWRVGRMVGASVRCIAYETEPEVSSIQSVTRATCPTTPTTVYDERDGEAYTIRQLADGNCWMLDNLRTVDITLTSKDSNLPEGETYTIPKSDRNSFGGVDRSSAYVDPRYGGYYSYITATAGWGVNSLTYGTATKDICPKGWRLPTGNTYGEFGNLYGYYSSPELLRGDPSLDFGGYIYSQDGTLRGNDYHGYYWTATINRGDTNYVYSFIFDEYSVDPTHRQPSHYGYAVRCIAK